MFESAILLVKIPVVAVPWLLKTLTGHYGARYELANKIASAAKELERNVQALGDETTFAKLDLLSRDADQPTADCEWFDVFYGAAGRRLNDYNIFPRKLQSELSDLREAISDSRERWDDELAGATDSSLKNFAHYIRAGACELERMALPVSLVVAGKQFLRRKNMGFNVRD